MSKHARDASDSSPVQGNDSSQCAEPDAKHFRPSSPVPDDDPSPKDLETFPRGWTRRGENISDGLMQVVTRNEMGHVVGFPEVMSESEPIRYNTTMTGDDAGVHPLKLLIEICTCDRLVCGPCDGCKSFEDNEGRGFSGASASTYEMMFGSRIVLWEISRMSMTIHQTFPTGRVVVTNATSAERREYVNARPRVRASAAAASSSAPVDEQHFRPSSRVPEDDPSHKAVSELWREAVARNKVLMQHLNSPAASSNEMKESGPDEVMRDVVASPPAIIRTASISDGSLRLANSPPRQRVPFPYTSSDDQETRSMTTQQRMNIEEAEMLANLRCEFFDAHGYAVIKATSMLASFAHEWAGIMDRYVLKDRIKKQEDGAEREPPIWIDLNRFKKQRVPVMLKAARLHMAACLIDLGIADQTDMETEAKKITPISLKLECNKAGLNVPHSAAHSDTVEFYICLTDRESIAVRKIHTDNEFEELELWPGDTLVLLGETERKFATGELEDGHRMCLVAKCAL